MKYKLTTMIIGLLIIGLYGLLPKVNAAPGDLDTTFSQDGISTEAFAQGIAYATVIQPDGKIVVVGIDFAGADSFRVVRFNPDGSFDTSFDGDGKVSTTIGTSNSFPQDVAIQADGKIVVAGFGFGVDGDFAVIRYNQNGSLDTTFDVDGKVLTAVGTSTHDFLNSIAIQPDGKIVAEGRNQQIGNGNEFHSVVRYNQNGSLDTTFDTDGKLFPTINISNDVAVQPDGKIVLAGGGSEDGISGFMIARLNPNGSFDNSFDGDGRVVTPVVRGDVAHCVTIQPDGKIVAAGSSYRQSNSSYDFSVVRYNANGSLDTTFDTDGKIVTVFGDSSVINDIAVQPDGKILAAGTVFNNGRGDFGLVRYNLDGSPDSSYGTGGKVRLDIVGNNDDTLLGIALDSNNKAMVVGRGNNFFTVARIIGNVSPIAAPFDFDDDNKSDISIFRPSNGQWWINRSSTSSTTVAQFGISTDKIAPGDYTGDGKTDIAVWRPVSGEWFVLRSEDNSYFSIPFGTNGDVAVTSDYDGDGKTDFAVYRPSTFVWYINKSSGGVQIYQFGASGDVPATGDYDRDGKTDIAIYRPSNGFWFITRSSNSTFLVFQFGNATDKPVPGDYTGDGRTDIAIWRPSTGLWYILRSEDFSFYSFAFGANGDVPVPGDYDGDGRFDAAVFRPTEGIWYLNRSTSGFSTANFGINGDKPIPSAYVP